MPCCTQELSRNIRRELAKLRLLLQQYAVLVGDAALFAADQVPRQPRTTLVTTGAAGESYQRNEQEPSITSASPAASMLHVKPGTSAAVTHRTCFAHRH